MNSTRLMNDQVGTSAIGRRKYAVQNNSWWSNPQSNSNTYYPFNNRTTSTSTAATPPTNPPISPTSASSVAKEERLDQIALSKRGYEWLRINRTTEPKMSKRAKIRRVFLVCHDSSFLSKGSFDQRVVDGVLEKLSDIKFNAVYSSTHPAGVGMGQCFEKMKTHVESTEYLEDPIWVDQIRLYIEETYLKFDDKGVPFEALGTTMDGYVRWRESTGNQVLGHERQNLYRRKKSKSKKKEKRDPVDLGEGRRLTKWRDVTLESVKKGLHRSAMKSEIVENILLLCGGDVIQGLINTMSGRCLTNPMKPGSLSVIYMTDSKASNDDIRSFNHFFHIKSGTKSRLIRTFEMYKKGESTPSFRLQQPRHVRLVDGFRGGTKETSEITNKSKGRVYVRLEVYRHQLYTETT